jgi:dihydrofolate reductase
MRQLIVQQIVSLDGYILEEGTEFRRWRSEFEAESDDDEADEHNVSMLRRAGTHVMGRVTYEAMAAHWPASAIGSGRSLFAGVDVLQPLQLASSRAFTCGVVALIYERARTVDLA